MLANSTIFLFDILSCYLILDILRRHCYWKVFSFFSSALVIFQVSHPYKSSGLISDLKRWMLFFLPMPRALHILQSLLRPDIRIHLIYILFCFTVHHYLTLESSLLTFECLTLSGYSFIATLAIPYSSLFVFSIRSLNFEKKGQDHQRQLLKLWNIFWKGLERRSSLSHQGTAMCLSYSLNRRTHRPQFASEQSGFGSSFGCEFKWKNIKKRFLADPFICLTVYMISIIIPVIKWYDIKITQARS